MIERIDNPTAPAASKKTADHAKPASGSSFAKVHASALKRAAASAASAKADSTITAASEETWKPVSGVMDYAKISAGPRAGQYIDLTKGTHHGRAFKIEQRDGHTVHVFQGADGAEEVVKPHGRKHKLTADTRPGKGETWAPVKGHHGYADVLSGSRNGLYVNISGGPRSGEAFQLVRRGHDELHIYGEGKDRRVVAVPVHDHKTAAKKS
jgi:hypothetical protein